MGGLSRKRKIPRIVKKSKKPSQKKGINQAHLPEGIRKHWQASLSVKENFKALGLALNLQPRMLQSKEGSKITDVATKTIHQGYYREHPVVQESEDVELGNEKAVKKGEQVGIQDIFPELKPESECPFERTGKKLGFDEDNICKKMIAKYGDNTIKMARDIKVNILQWSKGQVQQKIKVYQKSHQ